MKCFEKSGFAQHTDLNDQLCIDLFTELEKIQAEFLKHEHAFRSDEYLKKWPSDALHWWSRCWEYPYVFYHLRNYKPKTGKLRVLDLGSGVTFFPFAIAREGMDVIAIDVDKIVERDLPEAAKYVSPSPGVIEVAIANGDTVPVDDNVIDIVYCISVLEHLDNYVNIIAEVQRVLKKDGLFILTIDIDVKGNVTIGPDKFYRIIECLSGTFGVVYDSISVHPQDMLTSDTGPYPMVSNDSLIDQLRKYIRTAIGKRNPPKSVLACYGIVLRKV